MNEVANTNFRWVFELILNAANKNSVPWEEMPQRLYIISNMEFDDCAEDASVTNFEYARRFFRGGVYVNEKVGDEWFMQLSHKYEVERMELKVKIPDLRNKLIQSGEKQNEREHFIKAIRKFMQMERLTAPLLRELIDRIEVFETEGVGNNRTQRIVIYYRFVGYIEMPKAPPRDNYKSDTRKGVAVEYIPKPLSA